MREELAHRAHQLHNERVAGRSAVARDLAHGIEQAVQELDRWSLRNRLALAAAFEHLTAPLSAEVLRQSRGAFRGEGYMHRNFTASLPANVDTLRSGLEGNLETARHAADMMADFRELMTSIQMQQATFSTIVMAKQEGMKQVADMTSEGIRKSSDPRPQV